MCNCCSFHAHTLTLYAALCYQSNYRAAHALCQHVDQKQLLYAIRAEYMSGPLRQGFYDLLIALHLESHATTMEVCKNEYIIPLGELNILYSHIKIIFTQKEHFAVKLSVSLFMFHRPGTEGVVRERRDEAQPQVSGNRVGSSPDENDRHQVSTLDLKLNANPVTNSRHQGIFLPATKRSRI